MEEIITENINKIPFFIKKMKKVEDLIKKEDYKEAYKAVAALIEITNILVLEKVHNSEVEDSNIIRLIAMLEDKKETEIVDNLIEINGIYNSIELDEVTEIDVEIIVSYLNQILEIVLEKHGNIF